ncbi:hypothetical protein DPEC_G00318230 [Dallia pectoralis]|uniref:Uncharacterized protein n=1 Tax=Dallia pectoralis TaxID=75939 RepID=A0ACC2F9C1_DALPE|nr:hypothetical protein DPEC_G00318230 [Dallia pectoralis]
MRGLCKDEDYAFLEKMEKQHEDKDSLEEQMKEGKDDRNRQRQIREQQERLKDLENCRKEKELLWRHHVAELASTQEQRLRDRQARLRCFRDFQRRVLGEEMFLNALLSPSWF